ncbi:MAG: MFS transporter [Caldilineaceae bacterium]|nr:MFS transporter [Caldilineaceae bacterium]
MNNKRLYAASFGHFAIDILNSSIAIILTAVAAEFDLSVSQIGLAAMLYTFAASLTQPLFGILVDKLNGRWITGLGVLWTMTFYALAPWMPNYPALVTCLVIGALGSGAFHPAGMINATMAGGKYPTTATSIFFVLGQIGLAFGPVMTGILIQRYGLAAMPYMALAMTPAVLYALVVLRHPYEEEEAPAAVVAPPAKPTPAKPTVSAPAAPPAAAGSALGRTSRSGLYVALAFILLISLRSTTQQSFTMLLPRYFADQGYTPAMYGTMLGVLGLAGALGTFVGGYLGDRYNRRMVIFASMTLGALFSFLMLHTDGWAYVAVALGGGLMMNIPHSVLLIMAQRLLPKRKGMIGGAVLGLMFASGAAMAGLASWVADWVGLPAVLSVIALLPVGAGLCALLLPSTRGSESIAVEPVQGPAVSAAD